MPNKFEIVKRISRGKRPGAEEITVNFHGESITRHIINGVGRHPDDTIPALHQRLEERLAENKELTQHKKAAIEKLSKLKTGDKKGLEEIMRGVIVETITGMKPQQIADLAAKMQREVHQLEAARPVLEEALATVRKEDPLMVNYF